MNGAKVFTRYAALIAIVSVWIIFIAGMRQTGLHLLDSRPLSYLGVSDFAPYFRFGLLTGLILMAFFYLYLEQIFKPTKYFKNLYFTGLAMQLIVTFTPYELNGKFQWAHWAAAIILAVSLVFAPWIFADSPHIKGKVKKVSRAVTLFYLVMLVAEAISLIVFKYYVVSELINLMIFHAWVIYLTFGDNHKTQYTAAV